MNEIVSSLKIAGIAVTITFVWLRTNAFYEYFKWLPWKLLRKYEKFLHEESVNFAAFLIVYKHHFLIRLITCPVCLLFWLSIFAGLINGVILIPLTYIVSLILYSLICDKKF